MPVPVLRLALDDGEWFRYSGDPDRVPKFVDLENDLIFRELASLDLGDPVAIDRFLRAHGAIDLRDFPWAHLLVRAREAPPTQRESGEVHWQQVALYLRALRAMGNHWKFATTGQDPTEAWEAEGFIGAWPTSVAWERFESVLGHGLLHRAYSPRIRWVNTDPESDASSDRSAWDAPGMEVDEVMALWFDQRLPDLFSALCAEVWNLVVNGQPVRECANERCTSKVFTQKRGSTGNRTKRERYCSPGCERAQVQREYRRRQKRKQATKHIERTGVDPATSAGENT